MIQHCPRLLYLLFFYCSDNTPNSAYGREFILIYSSRERRAYHSGSEAEQQGTNMTAGTGTESSQGQAWQHLQELRDHIFICKLKAKIQPEVMHSFKFPNPAAGDVLPPARLHLYIAFKQHHQLGTKCTNPQAYGDVSHSKHHSV